MPPAACFRSLSDMPAFSGAHPSSAGRPVGAQPSARAPTRRPAAAAAPYYPHASHARAEPGSPARTPSRRSRFFAMPRIADEAPPLDLGQQVGGISGAAEPEGLARRGPDGGADGRECQRDTSGCRQRSRWGVYKNAALRSGWRAGCAGTRRSRRRRGQFAYGAPRRHPARCGMKQ